MITIYDIAKVCKLSPATVSKALNDYSDVNEKTRKRIMETAKSMGYYPNSQAQALIKKKSWNIGVLFEDGEKIGITHPLFAEILEGFKKTVESFGYDITFISNRIGELNLTYLGHCKYRQVDGVIIACTNFSSEEIKALINSDIPIVTIDFADEKVSCVKTNSYKGMELIYNHLYELGHRNIVYMHGEETYITEDRINGLKKAIVDKGECFESKMLIPAKYYSKSTGNRMMQEILNNENVPTAVIVSDDYTAIGVIEAVESRGLMIPEDISIVGYDGIYISSLLKPKLTTIKQDALEMGKVAAKKLINIIEKKRTENELIELEPILLIGGTTRIVKATD